MWWLLTREVLRLRGSISRDVPWEIMVDLYFYRDPNEEVPFTHSVSRHTASAMSHRNN